MTLKKRPAAMAILMIVALSLSGCSGSNKTITIIDNATTANEEYQSPGYYAPDSGSYYDASNEAAGVTAPEAQDQVIVPSQPSDYADLKYGAVVGYDVQVNPLNSVYTDIFAVNELVFEPVVELDESFKPQPLLAERWKVEGKTWTFTLRSGVQFHNGQPLSALDVVATYNKIIENRSPRWYSLVSQLIAGMTATDDTTLLVQGSSQGYMLLYAMTFPVVQRSTLDDALPMGTGPYWYASYVQDASVRLESNPLWWKRASGYVNSIQVSYYRNSRAALTGLELGEIDAIATDYPTAALNRGLTDRVCKDYSTQSYECIIPNLSSSKLSDVRVRQAIMYAIDRTTLCDTVYAGMAQESEVPVIPGSWLYDPQSAIYNYNPEKALQLLYEAGWYDKDQNGVLEKEMSGVTLNMSLNLVTYDRGTTSTRSEAAALIAKQLSKVGISVTVTTDSASDVKAAATRGNFDLALCSFELSEIPNLEFMLSTKSNLASYESRDMDGYLSEAYKATSADALKTAMSHVQMQVVEDLPILGLFFRAGVLVSRSEARNFGGTRQYDVLRGMARARASSD